MNVRRIITASLLSPFIIGFGSGMAVFLCEIAGLNGPFSKMASGELGGPPPSAFDKAATIAVLSSTFGYFLLLVPALMAEVILFLLFARQGRVPPIRQVVGTVLLGPFFSSFLLLYDRLGIVGREDVIVAVIIGLISGLALGLWWAVMSRPSQKHAT